MFKADMPFLPAPSHSCDQGLERMTGHVDELITSFVEFGISAAVLNMSLQLVSDNLSDSLEGRGVV